MLRKFKYIKYLLPGVFVLASCTKEFIDINQNPNDPTTISVSRLLPAAQKNMGDALSYGDGTPNPPRGGFSEILGVYVHHTTTREEQDQYGANGNAYWIVTGGWPIFWENCMANTEQIINDATAGGNPRYAGIAEIMKAYMISQLVDVFGDVPFSEALKFREGITYPKFDDDAAIYPQLFTLIDKGITDLNNTSNVIVPGNDDVIYKGNANSWIKAANSLKLKLYTQMRKITNVSAQVTQLLSDPTKLINATSETFAVPYGPNLATDDRNPAFGDIYATQRGNHISPWFYEILKGYNPSIFTGITDPRIPYYIYNQLTAGEAAENATEYRDGAFVSIYFGSVGPDRDRNQQNSISAMGIYPAGGRYDDGGGVSLGATSGTGAAPYRLITYADVLFLRAELILTGVITGDARAVLQQAMTESFRQVDVVVAAAKLASQTIPILVGSTAVTNYMNAVLAQYDAGDANKKLEIVMTEKWIQAFGSEIDPYTDYRRTGYPVLFNPNNPAHAPGGRAQPPINGNPARPGAQLSVPVQLTRTYPLSLPWSQAELETNPNAPAQKEPSTYKVFWMP